MRNLLAIARKELNVYFNTPIAYVMLCGMTFIGSYFFISFMGQFLQMSLIAQQAPSYMDPSRLNLTDIVMAPLLFNLGIILVFVVPFLSMRLMAEEKRQHTLELLMTSPLRPTEIVLGKYLGGILVLGLSVSLTGIYPAILSHYGGGESGDALEWSTVLLGYVGVTCTVHQ